MTKSGLVFGKYLQEKIRSAEGYLPGSCFFRQRLPMRRKREENCGQSVKKRLTPT